MNHKTIDFLFAYAYWKDYDFFHVVDKVCFNYLAEYPKNYVPF